MEEYIVDDSVLESNNGKYTVGQTVICSFARKITSTIIDPSGRLIEYFIDRSRFKNKQGKIYHIEDIPEVKDAIKYGGSRFSRRFGLIGTIQYLNEKAAVVRHSGDSCWPDCEYEDAYYLFDEIKPI